MRLCKFICAVVLGLFTQKPVLALTQSQFLQGKQSFKLWIGDQTKNTPVKVWFNEAKTASGILTNEIVVKLNDQNGFVDLTRISGAAIRRFKYDPLIFIITLSGPLHALEVSNKLNHNPFVKYAHPNFIVPKVWRQTWTPKDPLFANQWNLDNRGQTGGLRGADIRAIEAWSITRGSADTKIAILDGGFEAKHPDLVSSWDINNKEIADNQRDDDGNGLIDDVLGWNFLRNSNNLEDSEQVDHGMLVAGIAGARSNDIGLVGSCPECRIVPVVIGIDVVNDAEGFYYAVNRGADVISNSWGYDIGTPITAIVEEAIEHAATKGRNGKGSVVLFAMNNADQNDCSGEALDISSHPKVFAISASSDQDLKVSNSAWGSCLKVLAPTREFMRGAITTTDRLGSKGKNSGANSDDYSDLDYTKKSGGTSSATPLAAGVFGLILSVQPELTRSEAEKIIIDSADKIQPQLAKYNADGFSEKYGYGRINAAQALAETRVYSLRQKSKKVGKKPVLNKSKGRM